VKSRRKRRRPRFRGRAATSILDTFSPQDLATWEGESSVVQTYSDRVYFDLERQRISQHDQLCAALRSSSSTEVPLEGWVRVVDWRWNLTPLSAEGSLIGIGGRFNIGRELDRAKGKEFPCIYVAQDTGTAYCEHFGGLIGQRVSELTLGELALRTQESFTTFVLRGRVEHAFNLRDETRLAEFTRIIGRFDLSEDTKRYQRRHGLRPRSLVRSPRKLLQLALLSPHGWRRECQLGVPAPGQILGRFIRDAGFEAALYPSQRGGQLCLAVFPENFVASTSRIEVAGGIPDGANCTVLDRHNLCLKSPD